MTQPFVTASHDGEDKSTYVALEHTVADIESILAGDHDHSPPQIFKNMLTLADIKT